MRFLGYFFIFLYGLIFFSCSSINQSIKPRENLIDQNIEYKARGYGNIRLLSHQLLPIDYLHRHPEIKGLLVNHYMGTGKTYLGIGFAQSYPSRPVLVLAPKFLESNWRVSIENYGVINPSRFLFVSYDDAPKKLLHMDLSEYIVLADEVHNIVRLMRSLDTSMNEKYAQLYMQLRKAYKILGLTGTPIYSDESDLAFLVNLVSGEDLMPFNQETFRLMYTQVIPSRQFFRGYVTESNLIAYTLPFISMGVFASLLTDMGLGFLFGIPIGVFTPVVINSLYSLDSYKLRRLDMLKIAPVMNKYISYFKFDESSFKDFPAQKIKTIDVSYNREQYSFFLHLVEGDLPVDELQRLLRNNNVKQSNEFVKINSTRIHKQIYSSIGAGRDIGNFEFVNKEGKIIEPPKFLEIYKHLTKNNEQSVLYSNYYETGTEAFSHFLKRQGYKENYAIIHPSLNVAEVGQIVDNYNQGNIRLLLLHPDVTEGISLKGTQYLYILEPIINSTVFEQVVGRTRRFQSHSHLSKEKQTVNVLIYKSTSSIWNQDMWEIKRANWYKRYRELNYLSKWGIGLSQVDKKMDQKALNPEEIAEIKFKTIERNLSEMQKILTKESIENSYK